MHIWIDAETGTYGVANELYILSVNNDAEGIGDVLDALSERELGYLAKAFGNKVTDYVYG